MNSLTCPNCGAGVHSLVGHVNPAVFDGILWWSCGVCSWAWVRETPVLVRRVAAENEVAIHMDIRGRLTAELGEPNVAARDDNRGE